MSQPRFRGSKLVRDLERAAAALGYGPAQRTATGHLRFIHKVTGKIVITPSKAGGSLILNAYAELRRNA